MWNPLTNSLVGSDFYYIRTPPLPDSPPTKFNYFPCCSFRVTLKFSLPISPSALNIPPLFLTLLLNRVCWASVTSKTMETGEKTPEKSFARIPPPRGQVKVRIFKELVKGVKTAAKSGCSGGSASITQRPSSYASEGHSDTSPMWQSHPFVFLAWLPYFPLVLV